MLRIMFIISLLLVVAAGCGRPPCFKVNLHCSPTVSVDCEDREECRAIARYVLDNYPECTGYSISARDRSCFEDEVSE